MLGNILFFYKTSFLVWQILKTEAGTNEICAFKFVHRRTKVKETSYSNNVDPLVNVFGQIYLTVKYI